MLTDVVIGFSVLAILTTAVTMAWYKQRESLGVLAERRVVVQLAEGALAALQTGERERDNFVEKHTNANIVFVPISDASAPDGFLWARVTVSRDEHEASLLGLVPNDRLWEEK